MKNDKNLETLHAWLKCHQAHDIDGMLGYLTDDITVKSAAGGKMPPATSKEEARVHWQSIYDSIQDMGMEFVSATSENDVVFAELSHGGTMTGKMGDMEPTGKSYRVQGAFRFDFRDGKISSILSYWDTAAMIMQLGLKPKPEPAAQEN